MSKEFEYDPESGSFRFDEGGKAQKKDGGDIGSWIVIAALFAFGLWPIGLIALISKLSDRPKKASAPRSGMRTSTSPNANVTARSTNKVEKTVVQTAKKMNRAPKTSDKTARVLTIVGGILAACFGVALIPQIAEIISDGWYSYMLKDILSTGGFLAGGLVMFAAGRRMKRRSARIARYLAVMGERSYIGINELCAVSGKRRKTVERDLEFMVEKGMLSAGAYFDSGRGMFFRSAEAFAEYAEEKSRRENVTPKEANEGYAGALRAIRAANDRIADPVLSEKIDHLELVAGKIFREVEEHPEKQRQAATFLNYYLPTTLKLLDSYAKFEEAGIEGENLSRAQERIEETMDALIKGFDKQLDDLYRSEAMDIDSDIRVMENMLRRDTVSVEEDFGLGGAAVQRVPEEE
ncbi:MAG: 5-bromo-4-chloroindolyl phosphate hydrolysis family protein [Oscillospiraceae bacterium]|nr:5-bromo-4-chloroindolyl phosphate hydrolysis family protein [Oscillospiraceae bacterium]